MIKKLFFLNFLLCISMNAQEFLYPVGVMSHKRGKLYVLYQKSLNHVELWLWDSQTKHATKGLLSTFTPAGLKVLPDRSGFSFVDNGRLRVKQFNKRSPQTVAIYEPVYDVSTIEWITSKRFYFSACKQGRYTIFESSIDAEEVRTLIHDEDHDCLYPQKQGNQLFYIERCPTGSHYLMVAPYLTDHSVVDPDSVRTMLVDFDERSIAFLHMVSNTRGFCVEHPSAVSPNAKTIECQCHQLQKQHSGEWTSSELFSFSLPLELLVGNGESRLYESMLAFLPRYHKGYINFARCKEDNIYSLDIYSYNHSTRSIGARAIASHQTESFFSPIKCNDRIFYGGAVSQEDQETVKMWINEEGDTCFDLPSISA